MDVSPSITFPAYLLAKVMKEGPKVREVGASVEFATLYETWLVDEALYVARSL
jgi:hypothetical protein